jgi:hypothetical protein
LSVSGMMTVVMATIILMLLGLVSLVVDLGHLYAVKCELQNAAEAASHAGARALFPVSAVSGLIPATPDCDHARAVALQTVSSNRAEGLPLSIPAGDVQVGVWNWSTKALEPTACSSGINAVRVVTRKDGVANGPVKLTFAALFGMETFNLTARATSLLEGIGKVPKGKGAFAMAINQNKAPPLGDGLTLTLTPNHSDTGGWHAFFDPAANAQTLKELVNGSLPSPEIKMGDWINLTNGVVASVFQEMKRQFDTVHQGDWTILCPVIPDGNCVGQAQVLGFCALKVTEVLTSPDNLIRGQVVSNYLAMETEGGGPNFGTFSRSPRLVE